MLPIVIDLSRAEPAWQQLLQGVLDRIAGGHLAAGAKLPSVRAMAQAVRLNPNTVARAYRELEVLGVVQGLPGRGVFVTPEGPQLATEQRGGVLAESLRAAVVAAAAGGLDSQEIQRVVDAALRGAAAPTAPAAAPEGNETA